MIATKPFSQEVTKLWNEWEIRVMVLLSLFLQIILVIFGSRRKYTRNIQIFFLVWLAYLTADWVATVALGNLAHNQVDHDSMSFQSNNMLQALWAPFLLLHLGGPDTITAYSLEDNELWLRHFLGLVIQVLLAIYVMIRSWNNNTALRFIAIPMFITGIVKYGERSLVLWFSSARQLKNSLRSSHDTGPDFAEVLERGLWTGDGQDKSKQKIDDIESVDGQDKSKQEIDHIESGDEQDMSKQKIYHYLVVAGLLFERFRCLFADLILDHYERKESYSLISKESTKEAFKLVAIELGFMYDVLYTKASTIYSGFGIFLRCFYFFSHVSVSVVFLIIIFIMEKDAYSLIDISITCLLLVGAIFLEIYAFIILLFSDWMKLWLCTHNFISNNTPSDSHDSNKRWSGSVGQYNLLSFSLQDMSTKTAGVQKLIGVKEMIEKYQYLTWNYVDTDLKKSIFGQLVEKAKIIEGDHFDIKVCKELLSKRGDNVLQNKKYDCDELIWSTIEVEFDHSLLLWHIATDLCYYDDHRKQGSIIEKVYQCNTSKCVSDYMLYLLVVCPIMLPKGIGEIRYRETCAEAMKFFKRNRLETLSEISKACESLLEVKTDSLEKIKGGRSLSLLFYGCRLATQLQKLECNPAGWSREKKWEMIHDVWIEMLTYAASHCGWRPHGQHLGNGGELLTHVCLLMAHLGLSEQYQIQKQQVQYFKPSPPPARSPTYVEKSFGGRLLWRIRRVVKICFNNYILRNPNHPRPGLNDFIQMRWLKHRDWASNEQGTNRR